MMATTNGPVRAVCIVKKIAYYILVPTSNFVSFENIKRAPYLKLK